MRYSAERRRDNGGCRFEAIDSTGRFETVDEAVEAGRAKWGTDRPAAKGLAPELQTGRETVEVYDWVEHQYVCHVS